MEKQINVSYDALAALNQFVQEITKNVNNVDNTVSEDYMSPFAVWLLSKSDQPISTRTGKILTKSEIDDTTLDFTMSRNLSEESAEETIRFIWDKSAYLQMFNNRTTTKLVTPVQGRAITKKNLVSNEQNGAAVATVNRRIVHNFGINLYLKNINLQKDIPLQTVVNNLYNPNFYAETMNDVATALANDILLLATNGLEYTSYASSENFYDLNRGFVRILQLADGKNTNTYGSIAVTGWMGKYLTPQKVDAVGCTSTNYTAANLVTLMRKMYKAMLPEYRDDMGNVWMMSQADADLYMDSRSDMTSPSNTTREAVLTGGLVPNFMGRRIVVVPDMISINETHEYQSSVPGAIIFGNPKNIDIAMSKNDIVTSTDYNARGSYGATYEYDFQGYMDVQISKPESFVIAFSGAQLSPPVVVSAEGAINGISGEYTFSTPTYTIAAGATTKMHVCCDNAGAVIVKSLTDITGSSYDTYAELMALVAGDADTVILGNNDSFTLAGSDHVYLRACMPGDRAVASIGIDCNVTIS